MTLAELRSAAKSAGLPMSGNKAALMNRLQGTAPTASGGSNVSKSSLKTADSSAVRVSVQLDPALLKKMNMRLAGVSKGSDGQPQYTYMPIGRKATVASAKSAKPTATIAKRAPAKKITAKSTADIPDEVYEEAMDAFTMRMEKKKVPTILGQQMLGYFVDPKKIPKQKKKVFEMLAEQVLMETDDEEDDDDDDEDNDSGDESDDELEDEEGEHTREQDEAHANTREGVTASDGWHATDAAAEEG